MTKMVTIDTTLQALTEILDPLGVSSFPTPAIEISIEIPSWLLSTLGGELDGVAMIRTEDDRFVTKLAVNFIRAAVTALDRKDSTALNNIISKMDRTPGWTCVYYDDEDWNEWIDNPGDACRQCLILTHSPSDVAFFIYADGLGDLMSEEV